MQKAKKNYSKGKTAEFYLLNKEAIKKRQNKTQKNDRRRKASKKRISKQKEVNNYKKSAKTCQKLK